MSQTSAPPSGNALLEQLFELEAAKHDALQSFDADAYEAAAVEQARLVAVAGPLAEAEVSRDLVVKLAKLARLNSALLLNLISISPRFALAQPGYTAEGGLEGSPLNRLRIKG
jgi:hypothetical protein